MYFKYSLTISALSDSEGANGRKEMEKRSRKEERENANEGYDGK